MVAAKHKANYISELIDTHGNKISTYDQISQEAISFFEKLLGTADPGVVGCSTTILKELLPKVLPDEAQKDLIRPINPKEVKGTMFAIDGEKAPGLDGYTAQFFKSA